jgi:hypothetical protein
MGVDLSFEYQSAQNSETAYYDSLFNYEQWAQCRALINDIDLEYERITNVSPKAIYGKLFT